MGARARAAVRMALAGCLGATIGACGTSADPAPAQRGTATTDRLVAYVNPFVGTQAGAADFGTGGGAGNTFPGATLPFGMAQLSPDTYPSTDNFAGGYTYSDSQIRGFSLTHVSGAGCAIFQDLPFLPVARGVTGAPVTPFSAGLASAWRMPFDHAHERAEPGYYGVTLDPAGNAVDVELTATLHGGMARIRYPAGTPASLIWNVGGSGMADSAASVTIDPSRREISGSASSGRFCFQDNHYTVYFAAVFDRPFASTATWQKQLFTPGGTSASDTSPVALNYMPFPGGPASLPGDPSGTAQAGAVVGFDTSSDATVQLRVAISYVSVDNARANLAAELAGRDFDALHESASARWEAELRRIEVTTADARTRRMFYTALYHSLLSPYLFSDVNGDYHGFDGLVHNAPRPRYHTFSGWDIYRSQIPLLAMLDPVRTSDLMTSLVAEAAESGWLPKWSYADQHTDTMVGDPADIMIAGAQAFGARDFDTTAALDAMLKGATQVGQGSNPSSANDGYVERQGLPLYQSLGYVPLELDAPGVGGIGFVASSQYTWGSAATTLEYALADYAIAQFADAIGQSDRANGVRARAGSWRNLFNPATKSIEPRSASGQFQPNYDPTSGNGFVEGDGAQYTWFVPQDVAGLVTAMGGADAAAARLDEFFTEINAGPQSPHAFLGNEPCLSMPWLYAWLRQPWKTGPIVQRALTTLYDDAPTGMPGNDDLGTMSAWWVLASLGLNPGIPGRDVLLLDVPLLQAATLHLPGGDLHILREGDGAFPDRVTLDGRSLDRAWLRFADLREGGELHFSLSARPGTWATGEDSTPP